MERVASISSSTVHSTSGPSNTSEPFHCERRQALERSRGIVEGHPRVARERFGWQLDVAAAGTTRPAERSES
jgi:hypothetical protein